jgi:hypothetical protein
MRNLAILGLTLFSFTTFSGDVYSQGTFFGELIKISYKGEGKHKVFEGYLELPSGEIWKFNTLDSGIVRYLTDFVKVGYIQPEKEGEAFKGATTPYAAVNLKTVKDLKLRRVYTLPRSKVERLKEKEGYEYSQGFRCGRVQKIALKTFKTGWFSKKKAMQVELALTNVFGLPAVSCKEGNCKPVVWKAILPSEKGEFFTSFGEAEKDNLYNILMKEMGRFICVEYVQREPDPNDPFNYRVVGIFEVIRK